MIFSHGVFTNYFAASSIEVSKTIFWQINSIIFDLTNNLDYPKIKP